VKNAAISKSTVTFSGEQARDHHGKIANWRRSAAAARRA
jgi:hypothetical protein